MKYVLINIIYFLISLLSLDGKSKLVRSRKVDDMEVWSESGWGEIGYIHMTKPFVPWSITTSYSKRLVCADDHRVFNDRMEAVFVKEMGIGDYVMTTDGLERVLMVDKGHLAVNMCDITVMNKNESYYSNNILSHNTTTSAIFILHYILFNIDKNTLVVGNKRKTAIEILDKTKKIFNEIPYFLKPGIYKWNEGEIVLDNGCRIQAEATTQNSGIGLTLHCVLWDEAAHINPNIAESFYNNLFPTITAARARFIITSTQNGRNLFYRLYKAAEAGESEYKAFKVDWYQIPEYDPDRRCWVKRDEKWKRLQIANYGSEAAFNSQFGTNFDISSNTLISQQVLSRESTKTVEFINKDILGVPMSDYFYWHPGIDPMNMKKEYIVITCDLSEGIGGDYTLFNFNRLVEKGSDKLEGFGYFRSNTLKREDGIEALLKYISLYCDCQKVLLSFERNTYGDIFYKNIIDMIERGDDRFRDFDTNIIVRYSDNDSKKFYYGIKITPGNKSDHCKLFKEDYERGMIINNSYLAHTELSNFNDDGSGHYKAVFGHDDMVMTMVQLEFVKKTLQWKILRGEFDSSDESGGWSNEWKEDEIDPMYIGMDGSDIREGIMNDYYRRLNTIR